MATAGVTRPDSSPQSGSLRSLSITSPSQLVVTVATVAVVALALIPLARWAIVDATWSGTPAQCRASSGACWAFVAHKLSFILFGLYPPPERWRAVLAMVALVALVIATASPDRWHRRLAALWIIGVALVVWLLRGGAGLIEVPTNEWGGLPVTLLLTVLGLALGFPLAIALALGRRSGYPIVRAIAGAIVEGTRGIPLIAVLYVAVLVFPLALPPGGAEPDKLLLALGGVTLFAGAYLGEALRAALQIVPRARSEAALALGLVRWQAMRLVILPEALRVAVPSFVSIAVGFFQDTSLIVIIGLFDLLNTARLAAQDPEWLGFHTEAYVFVGVIYFVGSATLSRYGLWLERTLGRGRR